MHYQSVIFLQGDDYDDLEKALYPESEEASLGWPDMRAGMNYLRQYDSGEPTERCQTDYPACSGNDRHYETRYYVMVWSASYANAGLWRKVGNKSCTYDHTSA